MPERLRRLPASRRRLRAPNTVAFGLPLNEVRVALRNYQFGALTNDLAGANRQNGLPTARVTLDAVDVD